MIRHPHNVPDRGNGEYFQQRNREVTPEKFATMMRESDDASDWMRDQLKLKRYLRSQDASSII
ncbi:hypothetical protein V2K54_13305 [Pseudomonas alliivorans]|uniref:hypothetical protein n=1 Tax=Pseudomonas syringae TaxID=317 RepID=UPI00076045DF|nr:hypothetical protein [Pseudomonas syringae]MEE4957065.1 hypothetical protein [Pseudomonas alliivorans]KWS17196.1 hypothetical protein AL064_26075 [Pseudomonas syringae pv. syringae]MEE4965753.1 hypothetical protein [Pseudomonas alliivorans]MEE4988009.1 hypothetical protein [Pseudomonas alliivorans]MEE4992485.1 hypothetical protein [Pseudomonas alliivorans]